MPCGGASPRHAGGQGRNAMTAMTSKPNRERLNALQRKGLASGTIGVPSPV
jgi:hypothetical protein